MLTSWGPTDLSRIGNMAVVADVDVLEGMTDVLWGVKDPPKSRSTRSTQKS